MIQNPNTLIGVLIATTTIIITLLFLPALIELKKPKDAGPRIINDTVPKIRTTKLEILIIDIEEEQKFTYQSTIKTASSLSTLANLEG